MAINRSVLPKACSLFHMTGAFTLELNYGQRCMGIGCGTTIRCLDIDRFMENELILSE